MRVAYVAAIIICIWLLCGGVALAYGGTRGASHERHEQALKAKAAAERVSERLAAERQARAREERHEARWVRRWTGAYGSNVGRWADDAIKAGWRDDEMWTLGRIINAESGGRPRVVNYLGCAGLLQLHPCWYRDKWHFDPLDPQLNLRCGLWVKRHCGWGQWTTY